MSETVTITACESGRDWSSDDGKVNLTFYETTFDRNGAPFKADWGKQQGGDPPKVGEAVDVEFFEKNGKQRVRFSKGSGGGGSAGGGKYQKPQPPDAVARMGRAHAQEMALQWVSLQRLAEGKTFAISELWQVVDWFTTDVDAAGKAAKEGGGETSHNQVRSSAPAPSQNGQTHERIAVLLEAAGVNDVAARTISDHVLGEMTASEQDAVIETLESENRRGAAVKRLTALTEEKNGEPLPRPTADESIPFARPEYGEVFSERERHSNRP